MAERPDLQKELYAADQSGLAINPNVGEWFFRWLHMLTGAVTVGAFFVGLARPRTTSRSSRPAGTSSSSA